MGRDLKGKELGIGISQRKDGRYSARFTTREGKRVQKYFDKLPECREWIAEAQYRDEHCTISAGTQMTVSAWFDYYIDQIKYDIRSGTRDNYIRRFEAVKWGIGNLMLEDVKPLHITEVINDLRRKGYAPGTINSTVTILHEVFGTAVENEIIQKNPVTKKHRVSGDDSERRVLTVAEQRMILEDMQGGAFHDLVYFDLQTGLRAGELSGLTWSCIDFEKRMIHIRQQMTRDGKFSPLKTASGVRDIPMTDVAYEILMTRRRAQKLTRIDNSDLVFTTRTGNPVRTSAINEALKNSAERLGIEHFSAHTLRHTFATRCIEAGMKPKILQTILGHSNIAMTMDLYVHVTSDEKRAEMDVAEQTLKVV